jgi:hypothetical protein
VTINIDLDAIDAVLVAEPAATVAQSDLRDDAALAGFLVLLLYVEVGAVRDVRGVASVVVARPHQGLWSTCYKVASLLTVVIDMAIPMSFLYALTLHKGI